MEDLQLKGFTKVYQNGNELVLKRKWGGLLIYVFPFAFGLMMLWNMPSFAVFQILIWALPFIYLGAAGLFNQVIFTVDNQGIKIQNKPIPWFLPPDKTIPKADIKRVFVLNTQRRKNGYTTGSSYDVYVEPQNNQKTLIKSYEYVVGNRASENADKLGNLILQFLNQ